MIAEPVLLAAWVGTCAAGAASCTFTVDINSLGDRTTNAGATVDYTTFLPAALPAGYSASYDATTSTLTLTVTTTVAGQLSSYTIADTTSELSNVALIELPVIPPAPPPPVPIDLTVTATLVPSTVAPGGSMVHTLNVTNLSTTTASLTGTIVRVTIPSGFTPTFPDLGAGWSAAIGTFVTFTYAGVIPASGSATPIRITWTLGPVFAPGQQPMTGTIGTGSGGDTVRTNNAAVVVVTTV